MNISQYLAQVKQKFSTKNATEHTYRGILEQFLQNLLPDIQVTNEPKRRDCGAPDYILTKKDVPVAFIEAKNIGDSDLSGAKKTGNKEQFDRYKKSLSNIIFTDYLDFHLYQNGEFVTKIAIARLENGEIREIPENFSSLENILKNFCFHIGQNIKNPKQLAQMMAGKARLLSDVIEKALTSDEEKHEDSTLKDQMKAFKDILIHDITAKGFADVYAQTIAYGMFAARLHDKEINTFSRQEAAEKIPKTNPFLRKLFGYIAGPDVDDRIRWIVDDLAEVFLACNVEEILRNYGKKTKMEDPIIHFYETFLSEYDAKLRKSRGVWYTPAPVVNFIVRAVDEVLKDEFGLQNGLADNSKTLVSVDSQVPDKRSKTGYGKIEKEVHKVQILDPATGTGTFLAEVIKFIYQKFENQQGIWPSYVKEHLLPRLNGFELLMASYAMAHLKLDLLLSETGCKADPGQRFKVFLTNSLEEYHPDTGTLFASWLSDEANEANYIKRDAPVMCVIGNPPYSGISSNNGKWISDLIEDYKKEPGGKEKLKEKKHWLNDDYVKFLRYGQYFIEKNNSGILAFINPHGFLDNPTFRGMRWNLLKTYDKIYTIDLHGNSKKKETAPDGGVDQNVFDIMQGVAINIFVKTGKKEKNDLGKVFHYDLYGKRQEKYDFLSENSLEMVDFKELPNVAPNYFFVPKNSKSESEYNEGISVDEIFNLSSVGCVTANDGLNISMTKKEHELKIQDLLSLPESEWRVKYRRPKDAQSWKYIWAQDDARNNLEKSFSKIGYRPFDERVTLYTGKSGGLYARPVYHAMQHFLRGENLGYVFPRQCKGRGGFTHGFVTRNIIDCAFGDPYSGSGTYLFPLYLYPPQTPQSNLNLTELNHQSRHRTPNLNPEITQKIARTLNLNFIPDHELPDAKNPDSLTPLDILDYIYAVLHSPNYRKKYQEFLKIDFPHVPYPKNREKFQKLVEIGAKIRKIHLLDDESVNDLVTTYPVDGDNIVTKPKYEHGKVYVNDKQYFDNVPEIAWNFYIGGYQPAQKWLKDRKNRKLEFYDILHYQKIIRSLYETDLLMREVDNVLEF